jgi:hypothetical protein
MSLLPKILGAGSLTLKRGNLMPATVIVSTPVGNGWTIVKVVKLPQTDDAA